MFLARHYHRSNFNVYQKIPMRAGCQVADSQPAEVHYQMPCTDSLKILVTADCLMFLARHYHRSNFNVYQKIPMRAGCQVADSQPAEVHYQIPTTESCKIRMAAACPM